MVQFYIGAFINPETVVVVGKANIFKRTTGTEHRIAKRVLDNQVLNFKRLRTRHDVEAIPIN